MSLSLVIVIYILGDNKILVNSSIKISAKLRKSHNVLSFYRVRESIVANICRKINLAGAIRAIRKPWPYPALSYIICISCRK